MAHSQENDDLTDSPYIIVCIVGIQKLIPSLALKVVNQCPHAAVIILSARRGIKRDLDIFFVTIRPRSSLLVTVLILVVLLRLFWPKYNRVGTWTSTQRTTWRREARNGTERQGQPCRMTIRAVSTLQEVTSGCLVPFHPLFATHAILAFVPAIVKSLSCERNRSYPTKYTTLSKTVTLVMVINGLLKIIKNLSNRTLL